MKRTCSTLFLGFLLTLTLHAQQQSPAPVALVTAVEGAATLVHENEESQLTLGMQVREGSNIRVSVGSVALVFFSGELVSLRDGEELALASTLEASSLSTGGATRGLAREDGLAVAGTVSVAADDGDVWQAQLASVSGIRGDAMAIAIAPRLSIADALPTFCWYDTDSSALGADRLWTLHIKDDQGTVLFSQELRGKVGVFNLWRPQRLPPAFRADPRRRYSWGVYAAGAPAPAGELEAVFVYVDAEGMQNAAAQRSHLTSLMVNTSLDEMSYHTLSCTFSLDERERLFSDAIPHLFTLASWEQGRSWAAEQLARMFLRFGTQVAPLAPVVLALRPDMLPR
jgi:hypothetical protein